MVTSRRFMFPRDLLMPSADLWKCGGPVRAARADRSGKLPGDEEAGETGIDERIENGDSTGLAGPPRWSSGRSENPTRDHERGESDDVVVVLTECVEELQPAQQRWTRGRRAVIDRHVDGVRARGRGAEQHVEELLEPFHDGLALAVQRCRNGLDGGRRIPQHVGSRRDRLAGGAVGYRLEGGEV